MKPCALFLVAHGKLTGPLFDIYVGKGQLAKKREKIRLAKNHIAYKLYGLTTARPIWHIIAETVTMYD